MKNRIIKLLKETKRPGIEKLIEWMEGNGFFTAPCSGGHHLAKEGGLAEHSLNVYDLAEDLALTLCRDEPIASVNRQSVIIVALLHDLGKVGDHGKENYVPNILKSGKQSDSKPYITSTELLYLPHEVRSIAIAERFIDLTEEEEHAIYYHNGKYTHVGYDLKETPLQMLLHFADLWASRQIEKEEKGEEKND